MDSNQALYGSSTPQIPHLVLGSSLGKVLTGGVQEPWPSASCKQTGSSSQAVVCLPGVMVVPAPAKKDWEGTGVLQPSSLSLGVSLKITSLPTNLYPKANTRFRAGAWQHMAFLPLLPSFRAFPDLSVACVGW